MREKVEIIDEIILSLEEFKPKLEIPKWENFELDFSTDFENRKQIIEKIKENLGEKIGFYSIYNENQCLYIGIGRPIWKRIKSHYYSSQGKDKAKRWLDFFSENKGKLKIYWQEFSVSEDKKTDDKIRAIIENILENIYKPKFEEKKNVS
jgi:hypothetical protein